MVLYATSSVTSAPSFCSPWGGKLLAMSALGMRMHLPLRPPGSDLLSSSSTSSATYLEGWQSTLIEYLLTSPAVAGPMAQTLTPFNHLASPPRWRSLLKKLSTPFTLVKTNHWKVSNFFMALSMGPKSLGATIWIVGNSMTLAPSSSNSLAKSLAWSLALVTTMVLPKRGLFSNQLSFSLRLTTSPITVIAGGSMSFAFSTMSPRVPTTVF